MEDLSALHKREKEILNDFDTLCKKVGVKYYMAYGTLLGAVRHGDIIPWDDDIDVSMKREEYDKLVDYFSNNKSSKYTLDCFELNSSCVRLFAKLVRKSHEDDDLKTYFTHPSGLSIDIFPLDNARPESNVNQKIKGFLIKIIRKVVSSKHKLRNKCFKENICKKIVRHIFVAPFIMIDDRHLMSFCIRLCKSQNYTTPNLICYGTVYSNSVENASKDNWDYTVNLRLGEREYPAPCGYKYILEHLYGSDYMDLPPESMRYQHEHMNQFCN